MNVKKKRKKTLNANFKQLILGFNATKIFMNLVRKKLKSHIIIQVIFTIKLLINQVKYLNILDILIW